MTSAQIYGLASICCAAALSVGVVAAVDDSPARERYGALLREDRQLQNLVHLADSTNFYLVLDLGREELDLRYRGVPIRAYPARSIEMGRPRKLFLRASLSDDWYDRIWLGGKLVPERQRHDESLGATDDSTGFDPEWVPMLPEVLIPSPDRYRIVFPEGLVVEVVADSSAGGRGLWGRFIDRTRSLFSTSPRVRLVLAPDDAGRLYRSLPAESALALRSDQLPATPPAP